jgi:hypothetical protein
MKRKIMEVHGPYHKIFQCEDGSPGPYFDDYMLFAEYAVINTKYILRDPGVNGILLLSTFTTCATFMRIEIFYALLLLEFMVLFSTHAYAIGALQGAEGYQKGDYR